MSMPALYIMLVGRDYRFSVHAFSMHEITAFVHMSFHQCTAGTHMGKTQTHTVIALAKPR